MPAGFAGFVLEHLPAPPGRVLEVGCGTVGGVTPFLAVAGYEPLAIDPHAPKGPWFRRITLDELDDDGPFVGVVCGRVLHHVSPLGPALDRLAGLAPMLVADEFSWNHIDARAVAWYRAELEHLGTSQGPADLDEWIRVHDHLHTGETLLAAFDERWKTRVFESGPYFHRWLRARRDEEERLIAAGELPAIGWRYVGVTRST